MSTLCIVDGWLQVRSLAELDDGERRLWRVGVYVKRRDVDGMLAEMLGGEMVQRRPDEVDTRHIPQALLASIWEKVGPDARAVVLPFKYNPRPEDEDPARSFLFVEGHEAIFYNGFRLPIPEPTDDLTVEQIVHHMMDLCDAHMAHPDWLTCWRCPECGDFIVSMTGRNRIVTYFTETINRDFSSRFAKTRLPDSYWAKTCIKCGYVSITAKEAKLYGLEVPESEAST